MRRVNGVALLSRAVVCMGSSTAVGGATQQRLVQSAMLSTCSNSNPLWFTRRLGDHFGLWKPSVACGAGGHVCFSSNATSLAQEVHAQDKFLPKDVELYQYEACPFCNKVRGKLCTTFSYLEFNRRWNFPSFTSYFGYCDYFCMNWKFAFLVFIENWSYFENKRSYSGVHFQFILPGFMPLILFATELLLSLSILGLL